MMSFGKRRASKLILVVLWGLLSVATAAAASPSAPVAVLPLQNLSYGHNGLDLPFTRYLIKRLAASGTKTSRLEAVVAFMSNYRIRISGQLETFYITRLGDELGVAFVLMGAVIQKKDKPSPSLGVTLNLVRTRDARTIWSYVGAISAADHRKLLGLGEPKSAEKLEPALVDQILLSWPGEILTQQGQKAASIDSVVLEPRQVKPGDVVRCRVRLRDFWQGSRAPQVFVKADDQIYAATVEPDGKTYDTSWVAGKEDGRFPVNLVLTWARYDRTESEQVGSYTVDGVAPLISLSLKGASLDVDPPLFRNEVIIVPHKVIRKPIARWHLTFLDENDVVVATQTEKGDLPEALVWTGATQLAGGELVKKGVFQVKLEVWDEAGNKGSATSRFELDQTPPVVAVTAVKEGQKVNLDLKHDNKKVPLAFWRLEMWSKQGKLLKTAEGEDLPAQVDMELPDDADDKGIEGTLVIQDVLGNSDRRQLKNLLGASKPKKAEKKAEEKTATKAWVNEF